MQTLLCGNDWKRIRRIRHIGYNPIWSTSVMPMTPTTKVCKLCGAEVSSELSECPDDGGSLEQPGLDPLVGSVLVDKYEILSLLARGAMSKVYKAKQKAGNQFVAIKVLKKHLVDDPIALGRFEREAQAISLLQHPNIIRVLDFGVVEGSMGFLVMDFIEGRTLDEIIAADGHLSPARAVPIFRQIASALAKAYENNVIHRDLKPSNVCILKQADGNEVVKIVDFGLAKFVETSSRAERHLTKPGQVCGSPLYMSPEQVQGKPLDCRSDIYSFGCLMYETLSGNPPFVGGNTFETMSKRMEEEAPPFSSELAVPPALEAVVVRTLQKEPSLRYQTAQELENELPEFSSGSGGKIALSRWPIVTALCILVALVVLIVSNIH
jgi:serine/threonine protein kinase